MLVSGDYLYAERPLRSVLYYFRLIRACNLVKLGRLFAMMVLNHTIAAGTPTMELVRWSFSPMVILRSYGLELSNPFI